MLDVLSVEDSYVLKGQLQGSAAAMSLMPTAIFISCDEQLCLTRDKSVANLPRGISAGSRL